MNEFPKIIIAASAAAASCLKRHADDDPMQQGPKKPRFVTSSVCQYFPFRGSLMEHVTKYQSANVHNKLAQCCKYFFIRKPVIVGRNLESLYTENKWSEVIDGYYRGFDILSQKKFWLTENIDIVDELHSSKLTGYVDKLIVPKLYQSDIKSLKLHNVCLSLESLLFLGKKAMVVSLLYAAVKHSDGTIAKLESIVETLPHLQTLNYQLPSANIIGPETVQELLKLPHFNNMFSFWIFNLPESFNIDDFYSYNKTNVATQFLLDFRNNITDPYKQRLQNIVDEIVQTENHPYKVPLIEFPGQNEAANHTLDTLWRRR